MIKYNSETNLDSDIDSDIDKYAIYLRKSRADLEAEKIGEGETLARHKKILTDFAARKGLYIAKIFEEIVSGETIEARPEIQKLIQECYDGKYRGILVVEITRLSRGSQGDAQAIMDCLRYSNYGNGILVITPSKIYDIVHSQEDEEYMEFELFMSRREYKMIRKRMERGRIQCIIDGNYMGASRPYGYDIVSSKNIRTLVPNKDEAPIVKMIFNWAANDNRSAYWIAKQLSLMDVPTYNGCSEWGQYTIRTILNNPVYIGKIRWNCRPRMKMMVDGKLTSVRKRISENSNYMEYDGKHKKYSLVDEDTFLKVKERYQIDRTKTDYTLKNPLAGLLRCKKCGKVMRYKTYNGHESYTRYTHPNSTKCNVKPVSAKDIMNAVIYAIGKYIEDFKVKINNYEESNNSEIAEQLNILETDLKKTEKKISKLFDSLENEIITDEEFLERKNIHLKHISNVKDQINALNNSISQKEDYSEKIVQFSECITILQDNDIDAKTKNEYLKSIISRIDFSRENQGEFILDIDLL